MDDEVPAGYWQALIEAMRAWALLPEPEDIEDLPLLDDQSWLS